jgi:hypothetical protein
LVGDHGGAPGSDFGVGGGGLSTDAGGGLFMVFGDGGGHVGPLIGAWADELSLPVVSQPAAISVVSAVRASNGSIVLIYQSRLAVFDAAS